MFKEVWEFNTTEFLPPRGYLYYHPLPVIQIASESSPDICPAKQMWVEPGTMSWLPFYYLTPNKNNLVKLFAATLATSVILY